MPGTRVWIEPGCIQCNWCSDLSPEIFQAGETTSMIRGDARVDDRTDTNDAKAVLRLRFDDTAREFLEFVAAGCPVQVIRIADD